MIMSMIRVKTIGVRRQPEMTAHVSGEALAAGARFSESIAQLAKSTFIPKGVYRFKIQVPRSRQQTPTGLPGPRHGAIGGNTKP
jgi:hypothetical protein